MKQIIIRTALILLVSGTSVIAQGIPQFANANSASKIGINIFERNSEGLQISFVEKNTKFTPSEKRIIKEIVTDSEKKVRALLPTIPRNISVKIAIIDRKIDIVGGVTGRADAPGEVVVELSSVYPGGIVGAARAGLAGTIFHEFHHLYRGWTIRGNKFGQGISIAAVNEGLAVVFSENYTKEVFEGNAYPKNAMKWVEEIVALPKNADYGKWMFTHPDGRTAIGYRAGNYLVRRAMTRSGKNILELGSLSPNEILKLAGAITK